MSAWTWLRERVMERGRARRLGEDDAPADLGVAASRDEGGVGDGAGGDAGSTTGTAESQEFVGRVSGQDVGYAGETGAEVRAEAAAEAASKSGRHARGSST